MSEPLMPRYPVVQTGGVTGSMYGNIDQQHIGALLGADITTATGSDLSLRGVNASLDLAGTGLTYDTNEQLTGGMVYHIAYSAGSFTAVLDTPLISAAPFDTWVLTDATDQAVQTILAGNDQITGSSHAELIRTFGGNDLIEGGGGGDTIYGGQGDDQIYATFGPRTSGWPAPGSSYLRGEEGNDYIVGGASFDDINGNQGNDTCSGGPGDDWVVGGKDHDLLFGDDGNDIVYGNLGNDTCLGGNGDDVIRGGQGDDVIYGDAGNDWISGDRGNDTMTGGAGADTFHTFSGAGIDKVTDFNAAEGDRVQLDQGTHYTLSQVGADTVIDMGNGDQMILVGVQLNTLPNGWIFTA